MTGIAGVGMFCIVFHTNKSSVDQSQTQVFVVIYGGSELYALNETQAPLELLFSWIPSANTDLLKKIASVVFELKFRIGSEGINASQSFMTSLDACIQYIPVQQQFLAMEAAVPAWDGPYFELREGWN